MGQLRTATHTLATLDLSPSQVLTTLDQSPAVGVGAGMTRLADALTTVGQLSLKEACDVLLSQVAHHPADDIAILLARSG